MKQKSKQIKIKKVPNKIYVITYKSKVRKYEFNSGHHFLNERDANKYWDFLINDKYIVAAAMYIAIKKKEYFKR